MSDQADEIAQQGAHRMTGVNRRIRAIDKQMQQLPALDALRQFAAGLDPDRADVDPLSNTGLLFHGLTAAVAGSRGIEPDAIARVARAQAGRETPQYTARLLETAPRDPLIAVRNTPAHRLPGLPADSTINHYVSVAREAPLERLRTGWIAAGEMAGWAESLCCAVEAEIGAGQPGSACFEWFLGHFFGIGRMYLIQGLGDSSPSTGQQALTALELVFSTDAINSMLAATDADGHETLRCLAPPFLLQLAAIKGGPGRARPGPHK
ncbi:hypothetical protein ACFRMQ_11035 [Kitasatospora sp. NPDC056783]|uniref:hypothetical protein n=1 Tax=Kitasatospora sp. NPDC056783 TaxID=3345943 RepID=UPI0036945B16